MPIRTRYLGRGRYLETWEGIITGDDVYLSADERKRWQAQDNSPQYVVIIDMRECRTLPPISSLRGAAQVHPLGKANFILFGGGLFFKLIGEMVSKFTGYRVVQVENLNEALKLADAWLNDIKEEQVS